jgi:hypothetical protein
VGFAAPVEDGGAGIVEGDGGAAIVAGGVLEVAGALEVCAATGNRNAPNATLNKVTLLYFVMGVFLLFSWILFSSSISGAVLPLNSVA